jgi:hypothetical protein
VVSSLSPFKSGGVQIFHSMGFCMSSFESESSDSLSEGSGSGGKNLEKGSSTIEGSDSGSESVSGSESGGGASGIFASLSSTGAGVGTSEEALTL